MKSKTASFIVGSLTLFIGLAVLGPGGASALTITMTDIGAAPMTDDQLDAFYHAALHWEGTFRDPVTVNIEIAFEALDAGILGSTRSARTTHSYSSVREALVAEAYGTAETTAVNSLSAGDSIQITDINGSRWDDQVTMTTANAKALGLGTGLDSDYTNPPVGVDARIKFSTAYASSFDYNPDDGISDDKLDFVSVATHEIGHALGFISVTDGQDYNNTMVLHPSVLDLFRFADTGGAHSLSTDVRRVTHGAAEYYDTSLNNVDLSHGSYDYTDPHCHAAGGSCQASHWDDELGNLLDASLARGERKTITTEDRHAFNYIGWSQNYPVVCCLHLDVLAGWFHIAELEKIPSFERRFDYFPPPPPPDTIRFPATANLALRAGFNFGNDEYGKPILRSGLGYARFEQAVKINPQIVQALEPVKGEEYLDPPGPPMSVMPQNLSEVFIQSDFKGVPFTFTSTCGKNGCPFDPRLGQFGGYRVPGFLDSQSDNQSGDADGHITLLLLAEDESGKPDPTGHNVFGIDPDDPDNVVVPLDPAGMDPLMPPVCGDLEHPIPLGDLNGNCIVNLVDLGIFAEHWLECTAPKCP